MPLVPKRTRIASAVAVGLLSATIGPIAGAAHAAPSRAPAPDAGQASQNVIVVLRNQHADLAMAKGARSARTDAGQRDQKPLIAKAQKLGAHNVRGFKTVNAFAAAATPAQVSELSADPAVAAVYPDLAIRRRPQEVRQPASANAAGSVGTEICPTDPAKPLLEPEALQVTNTAFTTATTPQAQNLVTGAGVKVAWLADGIDINNPDFIRADGSHVFVDYQDFSGEGPDAPSSAAEAFGDASSIAAQGRLVYDLSEFVNPAHPLPPGCNITIRGVAPGASLVGLKVFGNAPSAPTSRFIEAIDYAVNVAGVDVINESFGGNPFPDTGTDPISLADDAAVDAGVTVVASTGDSGTTNTIGSPSSDPKVIGVAATTTFRSYQQTGFAGAPQFSNGTWADNNISSLSSGGVTQKARVPDLAAPGDLGWALCSPNPDIYLDCIADNGTPAGLQNFGGTSQSSPLTAGAAALVIQAYQQTHHGKRPAPALVKRLLTSTAVDLGHPAYEQGAGLLNTLAAVQAARSWQDSNGSPTAAGTALVVDQTQLSLIGAPGSTASTQLTVRNVSRNTQTVNLGTRTMGPNTNIKTGEVTLNTATAPTYIDNLGTVRSFVTTTFAVPVGADRLDVSLAADTGGFAPRVILIDPHGTYTAYSIPQGAAHFGHVDVHFPGFGTWTAIFAVSKASGFNGPIKFSATRANFVTRGSVSPSTITLAPGASKTVTVRAPLPDQPSDVSASVQLTTPLGLTTSVPLTLRAVVPPRATTFTGVITGGNGRGNPAQSNAYYVDVPAGKKDLGISVTLADDPDDAIVGVLTAPDGQVYSFQSNLFVDAAGDLLAEDAFQIYRRNPQAGRWVFSMFVLDPVTGFELSQKFTVKVAYDTVKIEANVPNSTRTVLAAGTPVDIPVKITNTGAAPLTFFADGRLSQTGDLPLLELSGNSTDVPLPVPPGISPQWLVPTDSSKLTVAASGTQPVNLDVFYQSGNPDVYAAAQGNSATVKTSAAMVSPGLWLADVGQHGPFAGPAPTGSVSLAAVAHGQLFDPAVTSTTGDVWQAGVDSGANAAVSAALHKAIAAKAAGKKPIRAQSAKSSSSQATTAATPTGPLDVAPGETVTITVTITPTGPAHSVVRGHLYIDTFSFFIIGGDELIDFPYTYTIG